MTMNKYIFSKHSLYELQGVNVKLANIVLRALPKCEIDFRVTEGLRSLDRQKKLVKAGRSKTINSRHLTGNATDLVPINNGVPDWTDDGSFEKIYAAMKEAADELGFTFEWGGHWENFVDKPHFQL